MILSCYMLAADMDETWRLWHTIDTWWPEIEVLIEHGVTNARTEAANTGIKHIKRTGRGLPESSPLPSPYSAHQRRPTRGVNPLTR
jgi:Transposase